MADTQKEKDTKKPVGNAKSNLQRPGPLVSNDGALSFHTHQVIKLVQGRGPKNNKHPIMGLMAFASKLSPIHDAAKSDDPYADYFLIEIEKKLNDIREMLQFEETQLLEKAKAVSESIELNGAHSSKPSTFSARFKSPYAFGAAYLMQDLDNYVSHCFVLNNRMVINNGERNKRIDLALKQFRSLFTRARDYKAFGLTRKDFELKTAIAKTAMAYYEGLPRPITPSEALIKREERADFAPDINPLILAGSAEEDDLAPDEI